MGHFNHRWAGLERKAGCEFSLPFRAVNMGYFARCYISPKEEGHPNAAVLKTFQEASANLCSSLLVS
jgi:hypothetical protein